MKKDEIMDKVKDKIYKILRVVCLMLTIIFLLIGIIHKDFYGIVVAFLFFVVELIAYTE